MTKLVTVGLGVAASLALVACGSSSSSTSTTAASSTTSATSTTQAAAGGETIDLAADPSQIAYDTTSLSAKPGNVTIDFKNPNSSLPHDVCVQSPSGQNLGCSDQVTGGSTSLDLTDLKAGSYTFYCSVPGHEDAGMKGTLTVK
jgi:uncharacterized cupredoxin-like copper-binding protein